jgi:CHAT domain-containing protein
VRFLLVHADPRGSLSAARQEIQDIKTALETGWADQLKKGQLEIQVLEGASASGRQLNAALRDGTFDVIHYAGHAFFDPERPELSGLLLHPHKPDDARQEHVFFAQKIRRLVEGQPLVFLNACESSCTANETCAQQVTYLQEKAEGLASAFLYGGARGCIGSLWPVYDGAAARFAIAFYRQALDGQTVGEALRQARREIKRQFPDQITWAAFVLYGDPTARLPSVQG